MTEYFDERELAKMSIFQLRTAARKIGVASPTTKKKDQLVKDYLDIASGKTAPKISNRGRPPKPEVKSMNADEPTATPASERNYSDRYDRRDYDAMDGIGNNKSFPTISELLLNDDCESKSGVLDILQEGYGFLRAENCEYSNKDTYISAKIIKSLGLRMGDMVVGVAKKNAESSRPPALIAVEKVNGDRKSVV